MESDAEFLDGLIGRPITVSDRVRLFALARRGAAMTPRPIEEAPKDRELIGIERPPGEDRNYFSFIQWHEDKQRWMSRIGYDWSVNPAPTLWAICGASHYLDPLDFSLLPEEFFEVDDDEENAP